MAAIFVQANLDPKHGISSEYVMVDFICMGLLDLLGALTENYKMKNACPQLDSNPGPSAFEAMSLSVAYLNVDRVLPEYAFKFTCTM